MVDELYPDLAVDKQQQREVQTFLQLSSAAGRRFTAQDALSAANMGRLYMDPTPDLVAAAVDAGVSWDHPLLQNIMMEDKAEQDAGLFRRLTGEVFGGARGAIRGAGAGVEALWEEGLMRPLRTGIRAYQDDTDQSIVESYRQAGASDLTYAVGELAQDRPVNWGEGFFPKSELAYEQPGFGGDLKEGMQSRMAAGEDPYQALDETRSQLTQDFYEAEGDPITYQGQEVRESTRIHYKDRESPVSLGRTAAIRIADPQDALFNVVSGAIDSAARVGLDPINVPANEIGLAWKAKNAVIPEVAEAAGLFRSKRPWVNPVTTSEWFQTGRGQTMTKILAETDSIDDIFSLAGDLPMSAKIQLRNAIDPASVENILRPYMGTVLKEAPTPGLSQVLGDKVFGDPSALTIKAPDFLSDWGRRWTAASGDRMVSAYDVDHSFPAFRAQLDTIGASADDSDRILMKVALSEGDNRKMRAAYGDLIETTGAKLKELGYDDDRATFIMRQFLDEQDTAQAYLHDISGNPVVLEGADSIQIVLPDGTKGDLPIVGAHLDSEFAEHTLVLPSMREIRRATSTPRAITDSLFQSRMGYDPRGLRAGRVAQGMDAMQSVWRDFALIRTGWTFRVVGEEAIRRRAAGYTRVVNSPAQLLLASITDTQMTGLQGDTLDDFFRMKGLGASGWQRGLNNEALGTRFDRSRQAWSTVETRKLTGVDLETGADVLEWTARGREGIATEFIQLGSSRGGKAVSQMGVDDAFRHFSKTAEGQAEIADIVRRSGGGLTSKLDDPKSLRRWLESIDARQAEITGGDFGYRNAGDSVWRRSNGDEWVDPPWTWTGQRVDEELRQMNVAGRSKGNVAQRRDMLLNEMGLPAVDDMGDRQFVTLRNGKQELRDVLTDGTIHGEMTIDEITDLERNLPDLFDDDYLPPATVKTTNPELSKRLDSVYDKAVEAIFSTIMEKPSMVINRVPFAQTRYTQEMARFAIWSDGPTRTQITKWAKANNVYDDFLEFQNAELARMGLRRGKDVVAETTEGAAALARVERNAAKMKKAPVVKTVDIDGGRMVIRGSDDIRFGFDEKTGEFLGGIEGGWKQNPIMGTARDAQRRGVNSALRESMPGFGQNVGPIEITPEAFAAMTGRRGGLPKVDEPFASFKELDEMAKAKAVDDSKALFYDLAEKGNWADAIRFAAPFADAWWEVVSRWTQMLAPTGSMGGVGQALKNWERARQLGQEIQNQTSRPGQQGFFSEDQYGNRTFMWPGVGMLSPTLRESFRSTIAVESMLFIDPSSPRSVMLPGAGPFLVFPAQTVTPITDQIFGKALSNQMNDFIFGEFAPSELNRFEQIAEPFMPTWLRRFFDTTLSDRKAKVYGDEIAGMYSTLLYSGDSRWGDDTPAKSKRTMLQAQNGGTQLGIARIFDAALQPGSVQYSPAVTEMLSMDNGNFYLTTLAIGDEYDQARELFGDDQIAQMYILERYNLDPLNVTDKTRGVFGRPFSKEGWEKMKDNPQIGDQFPFTMMAFIPEGENPEFYGPAWIDQFVGPDPARENLSPEQARWVINNQKGQRAYDQQVLIRDQAEGQARRIFDDRPKGLRAYLDELNSWHTKQVMDISAEFWGWGSDRNIPGVAERPTYQMLHDELFAVTEPGEARSVALEFAPELVSFIDAVSGLEGQLESDSLALGNQPDWWLSAGGGLDNRQKKQDIHKWYIDGVMFYFAQIEEPAQRQSAEWVLERILTPRLEGVDFDERVLFEPVEPPAPSQDWVGESNRVPSTTELNAEGVSP